MIRPFTLVQAIHKRPEHVGAAYELVKAKVAKQLSKRTETEKKRVANPDHESSEDTVSEAEEEKVAADTTDHQDDYEKKRHKRTKEDIEREVLLMGDLYAILGLEHLQFEAGDADIK